MLALPGCVCTNRFSANISALQSKVTALPNAAWSRAYQAQHNAVLTGRTQNMDRSAVPFLVAHDTTSRDLLLCLLSLCSVSVCVSHCVCCITVP